jgi:hypothetical protein
MKTTLRLSALLLVLAPALAAAPLTETTAIHSRPDAAAPAIGYLKAGTDPSSAPETQAPAGWLAVELPGPHEAYVRNNDFNKALNIHPGAEIHLLPKADSAVLATMQEGDKTEITGLRSGWTQIKLFKNVVGYIRLGGAAAAPVASAAPVTAAPAAVPAPAPAAAPSDLAAAPASGLSRTVQGVLVETRRKFLVGPRQPYDYQLEDADGKRIAFLETSKVQPTTKLELYVNQFVTVSGSIRQTEDWKNLVVFVESIESK